MSRANGQADRQPRRAAAYRAVHARVLRGDLAAGRPINESRLAAELGISRTPLREALFLLEHDGFVRSDLARGFSVLPLSAREVREVYPMIWGLEGLALRAATRPVPADPAALERVNDELGRAGDPTQALDADGRWHAILLEACPNGRLLRMLASLKDVASRYEYAYMRAPDLIAVSVAQHRDIGRALAAHDVARAAALLEAHWQAGMEALLRRVDWVVHAAEAPGG